MKTLQNCALRHCKRDVGSVWIKDEKRIKTAMIESLYLDISDSFKDGSLELNNHSALTVGKFILALLGQFKFRFISKLFNL